MLETLELLHRGLAPVLGVPLALAGFLVAAARARAGARRGQALPALAWMTLALVLGMGLVVYLSVLLLGAASA